MAYLGLLYMLPLCMSMAMESRIAIIQEAARDLVLLIKSYYDKGIYKSFRKIRSYVSYIICRRSLSTLDKTFTLRSSTAFASQPLLQLLSIVQGFCANRPHSMLEELIAKIIPVQLKASIRTLTAEQGDYVSGG